MISNLQIRRENVKDYTVMGTLGFIGYYFSEKLKYEARNAGQKLLEYAARNAGQKLLGSSISPVALLGNLLSATRKNHFTAGIFVIGSAIYLTYKNIQQKYVADKVNEQQATIEEIDRENQNLHIQHQSTTSSYAMLQQEHDELKTDHRELARQQRQWEGTTIESADESEPEEESEEEIQRSEPLDEDSENLSDQSLPTVTLT